MTSEPSPLDPAEKVDLWRQRFFEAQAAAEEFILGEHGEEGLAAWIQANSRITAELLRAQRPAGVSATDHFMTRHAWELESGPGAVFRERIAVADAAGFDFDSDFSASRFGNWTLDEFKWAAGTGNLNGAHGGHVLAPVTGAR